MRENPQTGLKIVTKKKPKKETELGKLLRAKRATDNLTVEEAARLIGIAQSGLSELENGKRTPDMETIVGMYEGLGLPLNDLLRAVAKDKNVHVPERTESELAMALTDRAAAFPDLQQLLRGLEQTDPAKYHDFLRLFRFWEAQSDDSQ